MAYHYDGFKKNSGITKNECVENITQALSKLLETIIINNDVLHNERNPRVS